MSPPRSEWRLLNGQYLGEISALCFLHLPSHLSPLPYLLAGTGSELLLYNLETGKAVNSFQVFQGIRVHGITNCLAQSSSSSSSVVSFQIAVFGEKRVKLFNLNFDIPSSSQTLVLFHSLPNFNHWVLDVSFLKNCSAEEGDGCLAVGCSDNSVCIWDVSCSSVVLRVQYPERCLLYSMRLWGDTLEALRIASGTIFNEIIVWKVICQHVAPPLTSPLEDDMCSNNLSSNSAQLHCQQYKVAHISRLIGHEGSIFRMVWSSDGSKLVSVSDDRSARIWAVSAELKDSDDQEKQAAGPILFGHNARVWDCCICSSLIVTAGEDCTCRVWGMDGKLLKIIKEHIGRGVWRCLYDSNSSLLITAGFDSAIKVHQLPISLPHILEEQNPAGHAIDRRETLTSRIPSSSEHVGLMDSKSEYVRCLHFACEDTIYIATNHGYLYHAKLFGAQDVKWTKLIRICEEVAIVCMDLLSENWPQRSCAVDDWVALGDGKGNMTVVRVVGDTFTPGADFTITWSAGKERQLLGTFWCKALGKRFIFTADPRGILKLWKLHDSPPASHTSARTFDVFLIAEFKSCFGFRIMCLDASFEDEVLLCGDVRGNLILFPLLKDYLLDTPATAERKISPLSYFKGAHGISTVSSIYVAELSSNEIEIRSTGGDGCICYLEYDRGRQSLEFIGMKQVKELSLIQSASPNKNSPNDLANCGYAVGFASTDFIIWNLISETKVVQIPCGGWRRPHSYYLGNTAEMMNCFAYVKDDIIYVHRLWVHESERKMFPQNLHIQFHGREMHSLCFVSSDMLNEANGKHAHFCKDSWIATGCEDGTVRLTGYNSGVESWLTSKLLGEHVGGSAVRSICFVSKTHIIASDVTMSDLTNGKHTSTEDIENPCLLMSVGAKRVLTSWLLRDRRVDNKEKLLVKQEQNKNGNGYVPSFEVPSLSFKWLSTDMPTRNFSTQGKMNTDKIGVAENAARSKSDARSGASLLEKEADSKACLDDQHEDDWRYLAVTAFLVKYTGSRLTVCFVVVACSDATLTLRALVLPHRLWFDVALLVPLSSPVLALQHAVIPTQLPAEEKIRSGNFYIVISGSTDGSIAFWDLTYSIEAFMLQLSTIDVEKLTNCRTRPRTGRGSQGGRWWRSLSSRMAKKRPDVSTFACEAGEITNLDLVNHAPVGMTTQKSDAESCKRVCSSAKQRDSLEPEDNSFDFFPGICEIQPLHVLSNIHQSGVNCLHVAEIQACQSTDSGFIYNLISGGDDQALHCLKFDISASSMGRDSEVVTPDLVDLFSKSDNQIRKCGIRFLHHHKVSSAHSSSVKGVWTDGTWVFSTGLDQRVRCWLFEEQCKLIEQTHLIISVPEPEALHARACDRNQYEIAVAGRGMQMLQFFAS